jgi:pimeloyl-ACP methyl ester carboxylesterase
LRDDTVTEAARVVEVEAVAERQLKRTTSETESDSLSPTIVLVHGAGHTSLVWRSVQDHLRHPSVAIDLPGRRDRPGDLTSVSIEAAADSAAADVLTATNERLILVGHSAGGIVLPALASRLGARVDHLVFVAGLCAPEGGAAMDTFQPGHGASTTTRLREMRERYRGHMFATEGTEKSRAAIDDDRLAMSLDSLNYITQTISWEGVSPMLPRTFVRCLRDSMQTREIQARLAANCSASVVVDIDAGHNPAVDAPSDLAALLDRVADGNDARA